jgi:hypothetical protein
VYEELRSAATVPDTCMCSLVGESPGRTQELGSHGDAADRMATCTLGKTLPSE